MTYRHADLGSRDDCELLTRWYNDPEVKHLYNGFPDEKNLSIEFTPEYFERLGQKPPTADKYLNLFVLGDDRPIGQAICEINPPKLVERNPGTAWIALLIGDAPLRRQGLGTEITAHLEQLAEEAGAKQIEIGVFEYNTRALAFFEKLGYEEFMRRPERVWWKGKKWPEVRLLKTL